MAYRWGRILSRSGCCWRSSNWPMKKTAIKEIVVELGYSAVKNFSREFKVYVDVGPRAYRKNFLLLRVVWLIRKKLPVFTGGFFLFANMNFSGYIVSYRQRSRNYDKERKDKLCDCKLYAMAKNP